MLIVSHCSSVVGLHVSSVLFVHDCGVRARHVWCQIVCVFWASCGEIGRRVPLIVVGGVEWSH